MSKIDAAKDAVIAAAAFVVDIHDFIPATAKQKAAALKRLKKAVEKFEAEAEEAAQAAQGAA